MSAANRIPSQSISQEHNTTGSSRDYTLLGLQMITGLMLVIAVIASIVYLVMAVQWLNQTFVGFNANYTLVIDGSQSFANDGSNPAENEWAGLAAGLQRLDRITGVNSIALVEDDYATARQQLREQVAMMSYGEMITIAFERPVENPDTFMSTLPEGVLCDAPVDGFATCDVSYRLSPTHPADFLAYFVFPYITGVIALAVGVALMFLRFNEISALLVTMFCVSLAVFSMGTFNYNTTYFALPIWLVSIAVAACTASLIALTLPTRLAFTYRYPMVLAIPPFVLAGVVAYDLSLFYNASDPYVFSLVWQIPVVFGLLSAVLLGVSLLLRRRYVVSSIQRDQINTVLISIGIAMLPILMWLISTVSILAGYERFILPINNATLMPFFISIPIGMAYAVLQYRGFNTDNVLSQGVTYGILLIGLVIGYAILVFGVNLLVINFIDPENAATIVPENFANNPFVIGLSIFLIAIAFLPVRSRLQRQIDRIYYRERREYQEEIEKFAAEVSITQSFTDIIHLYVDYVRDTLHARGVFVYLPDEETGDFVAHASSEPQTDVRFNTKSDMIAVLEQETHPIRVATAQTWMPELIPERSRLNILKAHLMTGLRGSRSVINGFVIIGPPQQGTYPYEEVRFLESISTQMAISVERSKVIESLERRVNELDVLSKVSQAVNFAVEFDDLLELISAQTQNLIEAQHFYIALRDPSTNQMYFAFFLEYDERVRSRENHRWAMGNDLFARVLDSGKAARYDDYSMTTRIMNLNDRGLVEDVTGWIAVPLIAGQTYLGVMAAATSRSGFIYSDEQLKIFNDIGSLAATSLDKARLFEETNERARQLRALNDISRQLQAERDIDRLINLITSSAVDILGAEAGSLLLNIEDATKEDHAPKDLEFRVVIGGSGQDLVGTRVPAGHGLVGEVAEFGKPVIVNDTQEDTRWEGEVSTEGEFHTNAVLAVPLMANNLVIGVLEVLNKRDGSLYVKEDADVLETFAGQAAIALENARLFQETDEQLKRRLRELETLERIDAELNRALDVERVAAITMKWAIADSGANAGVLGLVLHDEDPPLLQVQNLYGYTEEDFPPGADKDYWPLAKGIASRVLRTKRADTQTDVTIDPDYVPSLKGGNSQITVPMLAGGEIIALLILEKNTEPRLTLLDQAFVQRLADHAAIALENARLYSELSQANKVQSDMMGIGAHELKNALAPAKGWADFLLSGVMGTVNEQQQSSLSVIKSSVGRAELIIQDLRDFAKMRAQELRVNPEPIAFRNVVIETLRPFTSQIEEKEQQLVNNVSEDLPLIMGDHNRLIQIMTNFVSNANKYSPNEATITLNAVVERDKRNTNGTIIGDFLHIMVQDDGIGISKEDQKKMFQPYFRSTNDEAMEKPGTGLGMYLTRELIKQHGGDVWIESELGQGSTFHFTVPLAPEEEPASEPASD